MTVDPGQAAMGAADRTDRRVTERGVSAAKRFPLPDV